MRKPVKVAKPNIEDVFDAFCKFQIDARRAFINKQKLKMARDDFKKQLDDWGIGQLIDWTDKDE